jgi:acetamidase/formamidase
MTRHQLDPSPSTTAYVFSRDLPPVLTVDPGDTVVLRSLDASGHLRPQAFPGEEVPVMDGKKGRGHCLTGPITVRGAVPGQVLAVRFISLRPDTWGYTVAAGRDTPLTRRLGLHEGPPAWLLWQIDADTGTAVSNRRHTVRIAPFHGVTGVAWDEPAPGRRRRQHRLQGTGRRIGPVPAGHRARRAAECRRRPCCPG